jgi:hypothetical protein
MITKIIKHPANKKGAKQQPKPREISTLFPGNLLLRTGRPTMAGGASISFKYVDPNILRSVFSANVLNWRYRMNSVFDPDPLIASGAIPGFNEWASLFTTYRVRKFHYKITISSNETIPSVCYCLPTLNDHGPNWTVALPASAGNMGKTRVLPSVQGGQGTTMSGSIDLARWLGSTNYLTDDNYQSLVTSNPAGILYFYIGADAGAVHVNGVTVRVELTFDVDFTRRVDLVV